MRESSTPESKSDSDIEEDEQPEFKPTERQEYDHKPDAYTVGYDSTASTRIGIGRAKGDVGRLVRINEGRHQSDGNHSSREAARDKKRITQSFCSSLDIPRYQQREAVRVMGILNLDRFGYQKRLEKVALCVINVVVDVERTRLFFGGRDPSQLDLSSIDPENYPSNIRDEKQFNELCNHHDFSPKDRYSLSQLVKAELKRIDYL